MKHTQTHDSPESLDCLLTGSLPEYFTFHSIFQSHRIDPNSPSSHVMSPGIRLSLASNPLSHPETSHRSFRQRSLFVSRSLWRRHRVYLWLIFYLLLLTILHVSLYPESQVGALIRRQIELVLSEREEPGCLNWDPADDEIDDPRGCLKASQYRQVSEVLAREERGEQYVPLPLNSSFTRY